MIQEADTQHRSLLIGYMIIVLVLCGGRWAHSSELSAGSVGGSVKVVWGLGTSPVSGAKLQMRSTSNEGREYDSTTDAAGRYSINLPPGTYKVLLSWMGGGDCAEVHRAAFRLDHAEHLILDFLVVQCGMSEPMHKLLPGGGESDSSTPLQSPNPMNVPLNEQTEKYQEQLIPAAENRWPEIVLWFGKYDNRVDETRYFPLHQLLINPFRVPNPPVPLSLPVTLTIDRYTVRASSVILEKKSMVFKASGQVSVSDGTHTTTADSATISFSNGQPKVNLKR